LGVTDEVPPPDRELSDLGVEILRTPLDVELGRPGVFYDAVIISRPHNFHRLVAAVRQRQPQAALIYDGEALFHVRMARYAALEAQSDRRRQLEAEAGVMRAIEASIAASADAIVAISSDEARFFQTWGAAAVTVIRPTLSSASLGDRRFHERADIGFVPGWLGGEQSTNTDGLKWFAAHVLPIIASRAPHVRVLVTGRNPPASIRQLSSERLVLVGNQPDLSGFYNRVRAVITPVRYGAGVKLKSVEAIQHGVPQVATSQGAEGIDAEPGAIAVADRPEEFASHTLDLVTREERWAAAHAACRATVARWAQDTGDTWPAFLERTLLSRSPVAVAARVRRTLA
jgi:hypothetical protein